MNSESVKMLEAAEKTFQSGEKIAASFRRVLVIVAPPGSVSECFLPAVEREFPWIFIEQVDTVEAACSKFAYPVSLILVDAAFLDTLNAFCDVMNDWHPNAIIAVMYDDCPDHADTVDEILASKAVRSVLPMNLRLDIWLSVIRLMLRGGEYFPSSFFRKRRLVDIQPVNETSAPRAAKETRSVEGDIRMLNYLTEREIQVLEMVSHGCQNKLIAAKFNLSEHTIKVHLHNIIKKLGTRNRTAAAAMFLERDRSDGGQQSRAVLTLSGK